MYIKSAKVVQKKESVTWDWGRESRRVLQAGYAISAKVRLLHLGRTVRRKTLNEAKLLREQC